MQIEHRKSYGPIRLLDIECDEPYQWEEKRGTYIRVSLPFSIENQKKMSDKGFQFADRTIGVSINLRKTHLDYQSMIRIQPEFIQDNRSEILEIAKESFLTDRRFQLSWEYNNQIAERVLAGWIEELEEYYVCFYKGRIIGFLVLKDLPDNHSFIHLAAVKQKYRLTGAALSLYANAAEECKKQKKFFLDGRISSTNTAVMNLYASLGAVFFDPMDIFLKEV